MSILTDIIAYWKLDNNGSGGVSLVDSTGNENTLNNFETAVTLGAGIPNGNGCAVFSGEQWLETWIDPMEGTLEGDFTVSLWARPSSNAATGHLFQTGGTFVGGGVNLYLENGLIYFNDSYQASSINGLGSFLQDTWYNICVVKSSGTSSLYIDGSLVGSTQQANAIADWIAIGIDYNEYARFFNGRIDEVGIWGRALNLGEIFGIYNSGNGITYPFSGLILPPKNIVPRSSGAGKLGTDALRWAEGHFQDALKVGGRNVLTLHPASSVSLADNGDLAFEATSNTSLTIYYRGSDGVTRNAEIALT